MKLQGQSRQTPSPVATVKVASSTRFNPGPLQLTKLVFPSNTYRNRHSSIISNVATVKDEDLVQTQDSQWPKFQSQDENVGKERVVILGSGWGAASFLKALPESASKTYEFIVVSPRNYFLYTPLLPAVATGTMEERSIVEPIRNLVLGKGKYFEAVAQQIDVESKTIVACFPKDAGFPEACFKVQYDQLIVAVGSVNNTFGIQGVDKYCYYFKTVEDANKLRLRISECFERAALPFATSEEKAKLLSFVIVGGGPTGVEVAAELHDMITQDLSKLYPQLIPFVRIRVIELMSHVLSMYDRKISDYTAQLFSRNGIDLVLNSKVSGVKEGSVTVVDKDQNESEIAFGACVWATGIAKNPLIKQLQEQLPGQDHFRSIVTDRFLRVKGSNGSIWAVGDAATIDQQQALQYADELFEKADVNKDGKLQFSEIAKLLKDASVEFPHLEEHARFIDTKYGINRFGGLVRNALKSSKSKTLPVEDLNEQSELTKEEFKDLLKKIDSGLRALPATAQVARQQGEYLAQVLSTHSMKSGDEVPADVERFGYMHKGSLAYVGADRAVIDAPQVGPILGFGAGLVWKGFETYSQFSLKNKVLVALDWVRTKAFGRDISRV
eukprot:TRINITY_DN3446_c0_g1_i2.p1 TRINITY_DN3446_c0_g1~~TRINITY_DN3446_c0_g1_i2.p1  ORF type:complete len:611 (-),score=102.29 TRINITY_DN3446_c0_g1_i2:138-1970(-)